MTVGAAAGRSYDRGMLDPIAKPAAPKLTARETQVLDLVSSGRVDVNSLVTHRFPLDGTAEALMLAKHVPDSVKAVISPHQRSS